MPARKRKSSPAYPLGILTEPFRLEYVQRKLPSSELENLRRFAQQFNLPPTRERLLSVDPDLDNATLPSRREVTENSKRRWQEILDALAIHLKIDVERNDPRFWANLAIALMLRHLPALQTQQPAGAPEKTPEEHSYWLELLVQECAAKNIDWPNATTYRAIAKRAGLNDKNASEIVKANTRRALQWHRKNYPCRWAKIGKSISALK